MYSSTVLLIIFIFYNGEALTIRKRMTNGTLGLCQPTIHSSLTTILTCRDREGYKINCSEATNGAYLTYRCIDDGIYEVYAWRKIIHCIHGLWNQPQPECHPICGVKNVNARSLSIGSEDTKLNEYPWVVAVFRRMNSKMILNCGGTLITPRIVLTAAHCVSNGGNIVSKDEVEIAAGKHYLNYNDSRDTKAQYRKVFSIIMKEGFNDKKNYLYDIALLIAEEIFILRPEVQPACYDELPLPRVGSIGEIAGWGLTEDGEQSDHLKTLKIPFKDQTTCAAELPSDFVDKYHFHDKMCAGFYQHNKSVCKGDSGSGLVFPNPRNNRYYVQGIVSISPTSRDGTCNSKDNSLFTRVTVYYSWIEEQITILENQDQYQSCVLPEYPENGRWISSNGRKLPGESVPKDTFLRIECSDGFEPASPENIVCNGNWSKPFSKCLMPPRWILEPTDKAFAQSSDAVVECKADGFPKPVVTWKRATGVSPGDYKDFKPNNPDIKVEDGTLMINNIQKTNEGYYLCEAVNGIGSGLSTVILISVQAPPQFDVKYRNQTSRRGDPAVLQCGAKGEKPIGIIWNINNKRLEPKGDNRYTIREQILPNGVLSDLSIKKTERSDSATFSCVATNAFGSDDININMIVQEVPEVPYGFKVLDISGKTVQLSWVSPYDGNSSIKKFIIEYKPSKGSWDKNSERVLIPGDQTEAGIFTLRPATTYHIRIIAENDIGSSDPSDTVTIMTAEEVPSGPPTNIKVEAEDQHSLIVHWKPPLREQWNGYIQGYYVRYRLANSDTPYLGGTVKFQRNEEGEEHHLMISNLKTYTQYSVVMQAFNKVGAGPTSEEVRANTAEGVPEQPPEKATCTTLTAQTIIVSWVSPPLTSANGVIKGYKVIYAPSDTWFDENTKDTKITASSETILHGLKKYTNYSMEVLAYTSGGDGVRTTPIHCQTEQDVPEAPTALKALVMSAESILVSWKPPTEPNGIVEYYTVYYKPTGQDNEKPKSQRIVPNLKNQNLSYQANNLDSNLKYEFWVTAATTIGEGQSSKKVTVSTSASDRGGKMFGDRCRLTRECGFEGSICDDVTRRCLCKDELPVTNHIDKCGVSARVNESCFFTEQCEAVNLQTECKDGVCICRFNKQPFIDPDGQIGCDAE